MVMDWKLPNRELMKQFSYGEDISDPMFGAAIDSIPSAFANIQALSNMREERTWDVVNGMPPKQAFDREVEQFMYGEQESDAMFMDADSILNDDPDALQKAAFQLDNPDALMTPHGPALSNDEVDSILLSNPAITELSDIPDSDMLTEIESIADQLYEEPGFIEKFAQAIGLSSPVSASTDYTGEQFDWGNHNAVIQATEAIIEEGTQAQMNLGNAGMDDTSEVPVDIDGDDEGNFIQSAISGLLDVVLTEEGIRQGMPPWLSTGSSPFGSDPIGGLDKLSGGLSETFPMPILTGNSGSLEARTYREFDASIESDKDKGLLAGQTFLDQINNPEYNDIDRQVYQSYVMANEGNFDSDIFTAASHALRNQMIGSQTQDVTSPYGQGDDKAAGGMDITDIRAGGPVTAISAEATGDTRPYDLFVDELLQIPGSGSANVRNNMDNMYLKAMADFYLYNPQDSDSSIGSNDEGKSGKNPDWEDPWKQWTRDWLKDPEGLINSQGRTRRDRAMEVFQTLRDHEQNPLGMDREVDSILATFSPVHGGDSASKRLRMLENTLATEGMDPYMAKGVESVLDTMRVGMRDQTASQSLAFIGNLK